MTHLRSMGGAERQKSGEITAVKCYKHYATRMYLEELFKDFYTCEFEFEYKCNFV